MRGFKLLLILLLIPSVAWAVRASTMQTSFNAGEFSPFMEGHVDLEKRASAGLLIQNLIPLKQGPLVRRGGTRYVADVKTSTQRTGLIPFEFNVEQAYIIEASNSVFRFYRNNAQITSGGLPLELSTVYGGNDLFDDDNLFQIDHAQSADVMYLVHGSFAPQVLTRTGHTSWTINELTLTDGPFLPTNITDTTFTLSGTSGSITVTASSIVGVNNGDGFKASDIGRLIRWEDPANDWTWLKITAVASTTSLTATISGEDASAGTATIDWRLGVWSDTSGWPTTVTFYQDRLIMAGASSFPDRFDMSKTAGYSSTDAIFAPSDADGTVGDDAGVTGTLQSGRVNKIQWMASDGKGLLIGTTAQEWIIRSSEANAALTPSNAKADPVSSTGGAYIKAVQADASITFVQRARRKVFDLPYLFETDSLKPRDLTLAAEHITATQIVDMAYQQEPINVIWQARNDGTLIGLTYYPDQGVFGWSRHIIGGVSDSSGTQAEVESIAVIPDPNGQRDELWMTVKRYVNGATVRHIEYMTRFYEEDIDQEDAFHVDAGLTYDGTPVSTVSGLDHLEGETLKVMVDGRSHNDLTVSSGSITLANDITGSVIQAGLGNTWAFKSMRLEGGSKDGTSQGKTKRITGLTTRLNNCLGFQYGPNASNLDEFDFNQGDGFDETTELFTGDTPFLRWPGGYETAAHIYLTDSGVFPCAILAIMPQFKTYDR